jgi:hypothetical protein
MGGIISQYSMILAALKLFTFAVYKIFLRLKKNTTKYA